MISNYVGFFLHQVSYITNENEVIQETMKNSIKTYVILLIILAISGFSVQNNETNPSIQIKTELGNITVELFQGKAPLTVLNFIHYIDSGLFKGSCFYRVVRDDNQPHDSVKIAVIQGGRWENESNSFTPIKIETTKNTGILHKNGTISMARSSPDSATSEFFICIGDQPELDFGGKRNKDGLGFAAFGNVTEGMDIVKKIHSLIAPGQYLEKKVKIYDIIYLKK